MQRIIALYLRCLEGGLLNKFQDRDQEVEVAVQEEDSGGYGKLFTPDVFHLTVEGNKEVE